MISNLTQKLENLLNDCECNRGRGLDIRIDEGMIKTLREAITTIKELSTKLHTASMERSSMYYNGGWIPCEERLPEEYGDYLVIWHDIASNKNYYEIIEYDPDEDDPWIGDIPQAGRKGYKVIAWAPLPEFPYQPKEIEASND